jgi:hypothetical protein
LLEVADLGLQQANARLLHLDLRSTLAISVRSRPAMVLAR